MVQSSPCCGEQTKSEGTACESEVMVYKSVRMDLHIKFYHVTPAGLRKNQINVVKKEKFIRFPLDNQPLHSIKANFMACRYAGVVGAVDGTHIQIIAPSKDEDVFVNRKKVHFHQHEDCC
ncbi:putative nuclease HARBI1 [Merluccius polli]|uniref:Nuclease HARBI1 n=1 Tax=Merluccius polli TaxID=89951 RepID=A0AA47P678_MERPO|nr:putative nuclease HARBI1 [Merluccius polli]